MDNVSPKAFANLFKQPHSKNYTKIYLSACDGVNANVVKTIAECCPSLIKLALHQPKSSFENLITAEDLIYLASKCVKLQALDLCYTHSSIGTAIPKIVQYLPDLRSFKYCLNSSNTTSSKVILATTFTWLVTHLDGFDINVGLNSHLDETINGYRNNLLQ